MDVSSRKKRPSDAGLADWVTRRMNIWMHRSTGSTHRMPIIRAGVQLPVPLATLRSQGRSRGAAPRTDRGRGRLDPAAL